MQFFGVITPSSQTPTRRMAYAMQIRAIGGSSGYS
jgi:hypothetical protein